MTGECPAGEECSWLTPNGLHFVGNQLMDTILLTGPAATAVGGTQVVALEYDPGGGDRIALDQPFSADDDGGIGVRVESTSGSRVTIRGTGSRTNYLRIVDSEGRLMDRKELTGAALDAIELVPANFERVPADKQLAFAPGTRELGIALYGLVQHSSGPVRERLIDSSMVVDLAGAQRSGWDALRVPDAVVGTYPLSVTAGDKPAATLDFVVIDHADSISTIDPAPTKLATNKSLTICFVANAGNRYLAGLSWTYDVDGKQTVRDTGAFQANCLSVSTPKTSGSVSVQASAGGQSLSLVLGVGSSARAELPVDEVRETTIRSITTAGDRASM